MQALADIDRLKLQLMKPHPLRVLVTSKSPATVSLLNTMLSGFFIASVSSIEEAQEHLRNATTIHPPLDFVLLDDQSEHRADELARFLQALPVDTLKDTKIIHLYTPTTDSLSGHSAFTSDTPGVVRMTKPPRSGRLLQMLAVLKNPSQNKIIPSGGEAQSEDQKLAENRSLFGNVLIAEGEGSSLIRPGYHYTDSLFRQPCSAEASHQATRTPRPSCDSNVQWGRGCNWSGTLNPCILVSSDTVCRMGIS